MGCLNSQAPGYAPCPDGTYCFNDECVTTARASAYYQMSTEIEEQWKSGEISQGEWEQAGGVMLASLQAGWDPSTMGIRDSLYKNLYSVAPNLLEWSKTYLANPTEVQFSTVLGLSGYLPKVNPTTGELGFYYSGASPISISAVPDGLLTEGSVALLKERAVKLAFAAPTRDPEPGQLLMLTSLPLLGLQAGTTPKTKAQIAAETGQPPPDQPGTKGLGTNTILIVAGVGLAVVGAALFFLAKPSRA